MHVPAKLRFWAADGTAVFCESSVLAPANEFTDGELAECASKGQKERSEDSKSVGQIPQSTSPLPFPWVRGESMEKQGG